MNIIKWLSEPISKKQAIIFWVLSFIIVLTFWLIVPILMGAGARAISLAIEPSLHNLTVITSVSFGEEFTFRVLPIVTVLYFFPSKTKIAYLVAILFAYYFGIVHERMATENNCLGLGGLVLVFVYMKFGGAYNKPFNGFLACGSIHAGANLLVTGIAYVIMIYDL